MNRGRIQHRRSRRGLEALTAVAAASVLVACGASPAGETGTPDGSGPRQAAAMNHHDSSVPAAEPLREGERFHAVSLAAPYTPQPPADGTDEYRCFLLDPGLSEAAFVTGAQVLPQNGPLVHHANLSKVNAAQVESARKLDAEDPGDGWQCFGGTGVASGVGEAGGESSSEVYVGGWSPGHNEVVYDTVAGYPIEPGSRIVLQVHYSLLGAAPGAPTSDRSQVRLRLMPGTADVDPLKALLMPAPIELPCTSGETGPLCEREAAIADLTARTGQQAPKMVEQLNQLCNGGAAPKAGPTQSCEYPVTEDATLYGVGPHMHLLGKSITVELNPGTPQARKLLDQQTYNFDNQGIEEFAKPATLTKGDTVRVTCTHDAGLREALPQLQGLEPRYVVWGDGTSDEMCLGLLVTGPRV